MRFPSPHRSLTTILRTCALAILLAPLSVLAQDEDLVYYDNTYVDYVKTVRLHVAGFPHSYPMITLGGGAQLRLSFDDLSDEVRRYSYRFVHCDKDWQPSGLGPLEYNSGYEVDYLEEFDFSLRTLTEYVHYDLYFPNENMRLDVSGNYLLVVYDEEDEKIPVITRRFMVQENVAGVSGQVMQPAVVEKIHTHQEVDVTVNTQRLRLKVPMRELSLSVIQNGRWDNAVTNIVPNFIRPERADFNYQGKVVFRGGNEFRNLDIRSVQAPRTPTVSITNEGDFYAMMLEADLMRDFGTYLNYFDLNGDFVNFRFDRPVLTLGDQFLRETFDRLRFDFNGEYVEVTFVLDSRGKELARTPYLFGAFTEWQLKPNYRMVWNPNLNAYVGRAMIKQGFYNYYYVSERPAGERDDGSPVSYRITEGNYDDTENDYLALVYYRPIGGRYDRLVGTKILNSNQD